jgi:hypothetical protein
MPYFKPKKYFYISAAVSNFPTKAKESCNPIADFIRSCEIQQTVEIRISVDRIPLNILSIRKNGVN